MIRLLCIAGILVALTACSDFEPYATAPLPAPTGVTDAGTRVAICYDGLWSDANEVQRLAQHECAEKVTAVYADTDWRLDNCPLLLPARATFVCTPQK
jgi:hypothetical protein